MIVSLRHLRSLWPAGAHVDPATLAAKLPAIGIEVEHVAAVDDDTLLTLKITPNRGDALSHFGVARDLAVGFATAAPSPPPLAPLPPDDGGARVVLDDADCPLYVGVWFELEQAPVASALAVATLIAAGGERPIHPLVDLTNFVMLELGQPLHAFDADTLRGTVRVRAAQRGESLLTLIAAPGGGHVAVTFRGGELVIADDSGPIAMAGVVGGHATAVTAQTRRVLLESAHFAPARIMRGRRPHGLSTASSQRFERGVDPNGAERAARRYLHLLGEIATARVTHVHRAGAPPAPRHVEWDAPHAERLLGWLPPPGRCQAILDALGFVAATEHAQEGVAAGAARIVPSWRFDIDGNADLAEEIARIEGFDAFAPTLPHAPVAAARRDPGVAWRDRVLDALVALGYRQVIHHAFAPLPTAAAPAQSGDARDVVTLANPMGAESEALRGELIEGLLQAAARNHRHQLTDLRMCELGKVFRSRNGTIEETWRLGLLLTGDADPLAWQGRRAVDLYDMKGDVERLLATLGIHGCAWHGDAGDAARRWAGERTCFATATQPHRRALLVRAGDTDTIVLGIAAAVAADSSGALELHAPAVVAEFDLDALVAAAQAQSAPRFAEIPRQPGSTRDLAFLLPADVPAAAVLATLQAAAGAHLEDVRVFDVYAGKGIPDGQRSIAFRLSFRATDRTLAVEEVDAAVQAAVAAATARHGASLR